MPRPSNKRRVKREVMVGELAKTLWGLSVCLFIHELKVGGREILPCDDSSGDEEEWWGVLPERLVRLQPDAGDGDLDGSSDVLVQDEFLRDAIVFEVAWAFIEP
jgi:hypothetical protein